jgi:dephospho-CoA kinase
MAVAPVVGLTGGIGSGKSTVAGMLAELGARVIDADRIGHEVYRPGSDGFRRVVDAFGPGVVAPDGAIDRRKLGALVFATPAARARLNAIVHPQIADEVRRRIAAARAEGFAGPIVVEAAVLIEAGWRPLVERLWVVSAERETAIGRVMAARGLSREEVERRLDVQVAESEGRRVADLVLDNNGTPAALRAQVEQAWHSLVS